ncbi:hypothetical protein [Marinobacter nauticus]|uniref:Uncharacterized protein n=1 Tax=Marinobacter nauticus TaxID=2743 RepID=A0A1M2V0Y1_MARNT|nr:hypothetical protein [Marinobacter nauticus]OJT01235.1 hypothetical protein BEE62_14900 [Marinobacter nauticus]
MKLIGGSYGADGKVEIGSSNIIVNGRMIGRSKVKSMETRQHSQREFSAITLIVGLFLFVPLCALPAGFFFGDLAALLVGLAAFVFTMFATFDHVESRIVTITTDEDKTLSIQCNKKEAQRLQSFSPN